MPYFCVRAISTWTYLFKIYLAVRHLLTWDTDGRLQLLPPADAMQWNKAFGGSINLLTIINYRTCSTTDKKKNLKIYHHIVIHWHYQLRFRILFDMLQEIGYVSKHESLNLKDSLKVGSASVILGWTEGITILAGQVSNYWMKIIKSFCKKIDIHGKNKLPEWKSESWYN